MLETSKIKKEISRLLLHKDITDYAECSLLAEIKILESQSTHSWIKYNFGNPFSHPPEYGSYFVCRKDGKVHWEIWNGAGWAYNEKTITHWTKITNPNK
jgi:hypothetical protein